MRLLLQRHDRQGFGTPVENAAAHRCANSFCDEWAPVPVRNVSANLKGCSTRFTGDEGGDEMSTRRDFIKTGGALVVGFTLGDTLLAQERTGAAARFLDLKQI